MRASFKNENPAPGRGLIAHTVYRPRRLVCKPGGGNARSALCSRPSRWMGRPLCFETRAFGALLSMRAGRGIPPLPARRNRKNLRITGRTQVSIGPSPAYNFSLPTMMTFSMASGMRTKANGGVAFAPHRPSEASGGEDAKRLSISSDAYSQSLPRLPREVRSGSVLHVADGLLFEIVPRPRQGRWLRPFTVARPAAARERTAQARRRFDPGAPRRPRRPPCSGAVALRVT
jgi:hypothetical protein